MHTLNQKDSEKILNEIGVKPKKHLGQNFLISDQAAQNILRAINPDKSENVVEIGSGLGQITWFLANKSKSLFAIEKDHKLALFLTSQAEKNQISNVKIINSDVLKLEKEFWDQIPQPLKVVGNIPYYITGKLLKTLFSLKNLPQEIILVTQQEVAQRIVSQAPNSSRLGISVQVYGKPKIAGKLDPNCFWPKPQVNSSILVIAQISKKVFSQENISENDFFEILKTSFSHKRKMLINNLENSLGSKGADLTKIFKDLKLKITARPQELNFSDYLLLTSLLKNRNSSR